MQYFKSCIADEPQDYAKEFSDDLYNVYYSLNPEAAQRKKDRQLKKHQHEAQVGKWILKELKEREPLIVVCKNRCLQKERKR